MFRSPYEVRSRCALLCWPMVSLVVVLTLAMSRQVFAQAATASTSAVNSARAMFAARATATQTAADLRRTHRQSMDQATVILKDVGYGAGDIATAIRAEYAATAIPAHEAMTRAGFPSATTTAALNGAGIPVPMDCIDQKGYPVPCSVFGGMTNAPVTSQVSWSPTAKGYADSALTITGVNIPPVDVVIGSVLLAQVSATSAKVVVKLPAFPVKGALELRRKSDNVTGRLTSTFEVVPAPLMWTGLGTVAADAAVSDIQRWLSGARMVGTYCKVNGAVATATEGVFSTSTDFLGKVGSELVGAGAPSTVANAWDAVFRAAWWDWASKVTVPNLPWYPTFSLVTGSQAPPTSNVPTPLVALPSSGTASMYTPTLGAAVTAALGARATEPGAAAEIASFANVVGSRFVFYLAKGIVMGVMGSGPVPSYTVGAPSAGPVQNGTCSGSTVLGLTAVLF